jgi:hypothetical protein
MISPYECLDIDATGGMEGAASDTERHQTSGVGLILELTLGSLGFLFPLESA